MQQPAPVAALSKTSLILDCSNPGIVSSNPERGMGIYTHTHTHTHTHIYIYAFFYLWCVCVCSCVCVDRDLTIGRFPLQGILQKYLKDS